jgi:hypothetical protein
VREAREDIRLARRISEDAREWKLHDKPLYRDEELAEAQQWMARAAPSSDEVEFIRAGAEQDQRLKQEELERQARELAQKRVARSRGVALTFTMAMALVLIVLLVLQVFTQINLNTKDQALAKSNQALADSEATQAAENRQLRQSLPVNVTNLNDSGPGSLRAAIATATPGEAITFQKDLAGTITLTSGPLTIGQDVTISGPSSGQLSISGNHESRIFIVQSGLYVTMSNITLIDGHAAYDKSDLRPGAGGAIDNEAFLTLINVVMRDNVADTEGGAIYNYVNLQLINCTVEENTAASGGGGGIYNDGATLLLIRSAITANKAAGDGGGIAEVAPPNSAPDLTYTDVRSHSSITGDVTSKGMGGGVYVSGGRYDYDDTITVATNHPANFDCSTQAGCPSN